MATAGPAHTRHVLLAAGFSFLLGLAINRLVLLFIHRVRPYDSGVTSSVQPSHAGNIH